MTPRASMIVAVLALAGCREQTGSRPPPAASAAATAPTASTVAPPGTTTRKPRHDYDVPPPEPDVEERVAALLSNARSAAVDVVETNGFDAKWVFEGKPPSPEHPAGTAFLDGWDDSELSGHWEWDLATHAAKRIESHPGEWAASAAAGSRRAVMAVSENSDVQALIVAFHADGGEPFVEHSLTLGRGGHVVTHADGDLVACGWVDEGLDGKGAYDFHVDTIDAKSGKLLGRLKQRAKSVEWWRRAIALRVVGNAVYVGFPDAQGTRVLALGPDLRRRTAHAHVALRPDDVFPTPHHPAIFSTTGPNLFVALPNRLYELGQDLHVLHSIDVATEQGDGRGDPLVAVDAGSGAIVTAGGWYAPASGAAFRRAWDFSLPPWPPTDARAPFETNDLTWVHGRAVLVERCCDRSAILVFDPKKLH